MKWQNWLQNLAQRTRTSSVRGRRRGGRKQHTAGWYRRAALNSPTELLEQKTLLTANATLSIVATAMPAEDAGTVSLQVTLLDVDDTDGTDGILDNPVTVHVNTEDIAAAAGLDYTAIVGGTMAGTVTFPATTDTYNGGAGATINVDVTIDNDNRLEADEDFKVTLSNVMSSGDTIGTGNLVSTVTIDDNESATVSLDSSGTDALTEAAGGSQSASVAATLTITSDGTGTVGSDVTVTAGLAGNSDFSTTADASFGPGDYTSDGQNITITATNDQRLEATTESFPGQTVGITGAGGADVSADAGNSRTVTIDDNESGVVSIGTATATVVENGATANVPVTLDLTTDGTGTAGIDVTVSVGLTTSVLEFSDADASFTPGDGDPQMQNIVLTAVDDRLLEMTTESFPGQTLTDLSTGGADVTIAGGSGTYQVDVTDNEIGGLSVVYSNVNEGGGVQTVATVTLAITATGSGNVELDTGITLTADVTDAGGGEATDTTDYATPGTQTVTFDSNAATASTRTASLNPVDDQRVEGDESVNLVLGNLSAGGTNTTLTGTLTGAPDILDDDTATVAFDNATSDVDEETVDHVIGVTLTISPSGSVGDVGLDRTVTVDVIDDGTGAADEGTAANDDYTYTSPTTLTFNPFNGTSTASDSITLNIREDIVDDDAEDIDLTVAINTDSTGGQVTAAGQTTHEVTINDDDDATAIFEFPADSSADTIRVVNNGGTLEIYSGMTLLTSRSFASITNLVFVGADGEDDTLQVDLSGGDVIPAGGLSYSGGTAGNDTLEILGGMQGDVTYNYTNANDGDVMMSAFGTITYTGLEPITNTGTAANAIFNLPTVMTLSNLATLQNNASAGMNELTGANFEDTFFTNPTSSLTINLGGNGDTLTVNTLDAAYAASLIINGDGTESDQVDMTNVDIDTAGNGRGLWVTEVETLNITGGAITDNTVTGDGAGILLENSTSGTDTTAILDGVTITGNTAAGADGQGGGIYVDGPATVTIQNGSAIDSNTANLTGGGRDAGGGIYNDGADLTVDGSSVSSNNATQAFASGGGIFVAGGSLTLNNADVDGNTADWNGGGIFADLTSTVMITDGSVDGNTSNSQAGGGLFTQGTLTITGATSIDGNMAASDGGGVLVSNGTASITGATITNNSAADQGGGVFAASTATSLLLDGVTLGSTDNGNTADYGGGLYNATATTIQGSSSIAENDAQASGSAGGGIFNDGAGTLTISNSSITGNTASAGDGYGGGIQHSSTGTVGLTNVTLDGNDAYVGGGMNQDGSGAVTITGGTVSSNTAGYGAGINNYEGSLTVSGVTISGNMATGYGGGIAVYGSSATLLVEAGTTISGNTAGVDGGGIDNRDNGTVTVDASTISGNTATSGDGGGINDDGGTVIVQNGSLIDNNTAGGDGGGIDSEGPLTVDGSTISNNDAGADGGGIWSDGGITLQNTVSITGNTAADSGGGLYLAGTSSITDTTISGNTASGNGATDGGGGLFIDGVTVSLDATTSITGNFADGTSGNGGGIFVSAGGDLTLTGTTVTGNDATNGDGGGVYVDGTSTLDANGADISTNTAGADGGGIANAGTATVQGSATIDGNTAGTDGGGIANTGTLTVDGSSITNNDATSGDGGGIHDNGTLTLQNNVSIMTNTAGADGGGLFVTGAAPTITDTTIDDNTAATNGGGLYNDGLTFTLDGTTTITNNDATAGSGGGVFNNAGDLTLSGTIVGSTGNGNTAGADGGGIFNAAGSTLTFDSSASIAANTASVNGGGISNANGATLTVSGATIDGNTATGDGGGIQNDGVVLVDTGAMIINNEATTGNGGGINNDLNGMLTVDGSTIDNNTAGGDGGGIWNEGALTLQNMTMVTSNMAAGSGGGLFLDADTPSLSITDTTFDGNTADGSGTDGGGGIFNQGLTFTLGSGVFVTNNTASAGKGGGLFNESPGDVTLDGATVNGNDATVGNGGGVYNQNGATLDVTNAADISMNSAGTDGGGIWNDGTLEINSAPGPQVTITDNTAGDDGGGLYLGSNTTIVDFNRVDIDNNTASGAAATNGGGGIYNDGVTLNLGFTVIITNNDADGTDGAGGGVFNASNGTVNLTGTTVDSNTASGNGGGVYNPVGSTLTVDSSFTTTSISMNTAGEDGGGVWNGGDLTISGGTTLIDGNDAGSDGGGLYLDSTSTHAISDVTISDNTASEDTNPGGGGGIFNNDNDLTLDGTVSITGNHADGLAGSGGGILHFGTGTLDLNDTLIDSNSANRAGGGIEATDGTTVNLTTVTLTNNDVDGGAGTPNPGNGGGLHATMNVTIDIDGGTITGNDAAAEGGGLWNGTGTMTIRDDSGDVLIDDNTASGAGSDQGGGGLFNAGGIVEIQDNTGNSVTISNNVADGTQGSGGGILNDQGTVTITGAVIDSNTAERAGGGIETNVGTVTLHDITITGNSALGNGAAAGNGGGLHITGDGIVTIHTDDTSNDDTDSTISGNFASEEGGGLWNSSAGTLTLNVNGGLDAGDIVIDSNEAAGDGANQGGGGLFNDGGMVIITGTDNDDTVLITNNDATGATNGSGGGILSVGGTVDGDGAGGSIGNILIDNNTAVLGGGGVLIAGGTFVLENSLISNNSVSAGNGGGVQVTGGTVDIDATTIFGNSASANGGGLWNSDGAVNLTNTTITTNSAGNDGGGIYGSGTGLVDTDSVTITLNTAVGAGAGIFSSVAGSVSIENTIVAQNPGMGTEDNLGGGADAVASEDFNLIGDTDDGTLADPHTETIFDGDALLAPIGPSPLGENGNPNEVNSVIIPTHLPSAGSPAIGTGKTDLGVDQRDVVRPQASQDDIGAVEVNLNGFLVTAGGQANDGNPDEFLMIMDDQGTPDTFDDELVIFVNSAEVFREPALTTGQVIIRGSADDDTLVVDNDAADPLLVGSVANTTGAGLIRAQIIFDGDGTGGGGEPVSSPGGFDTLVFRGGTRTDTVYNPGESSDSGAVFQTENSITQRIEFFGLEPVQIVGAGAGSTLSVGSALSTMVAGFPQALQANNSITYTEGPNSNQPLDAVFAGAITGHISVDGYEGLEFTGFETLTIDAGNGSDTVSVNISADPDDLTTVNITGGDPTASDHLIVNSAAGTSDALVLTPTAQGAGTVGHFDGTLVDVDYTGFEELTLVGQLSDGDVFGVDGTAGDDSITYIAGATADTGTILGTMDGGTFTLGQVHFRGMDQSSTIVINQFGNQGGDDTFTFHGTTGNDFVELDGSGLLTAELNGELLAQIYVGTPNSTTLGAGTTAFIELELGDGDDEVEVTPEAGVEIFVNGSAGDNYLDFSGTGGDITFDPADVTISEDTLGDVFYSGFSGVGLDADGGNLVVNGTDDDDAFDVYPLTAGNDGDFEHNFSAAFVSYFSAASITFNGGDGADGIFLYGDDADNTVTSTSDTITIDGSSVTIGGDIEVIELETFAGDDDITLALTLATATKLVDAGDGNDTIDASGMTAGTFFGGAGNDMITGSAVADLIFGGLGDDTLAGDGGDDTIFGEDGDDEIDGGAGADRLDGGTGNDSATGGTGDDAFFGGADADTFTWNPGDGSDLVEGGTGSDNLQFNGSSADEIFGLSDEGGRLELTRDVGSVTLDIADVENVAIDATDGADTINVDELTTTGVQNLSLVLGADADGDTDAVVIGGSIAGDNITVAADGTDEVLIDGLSAQIFISGTTDATDTLTINGFEGDDVLTAEDGAEAELAITFNGGAGNDVLTGNGTLNGDAGNDVLTGGDGDNALDGGAGDDVINLSDGADTIVGGDGFDIVNYAGTEDDDTLSLTEAGNVLTVAGVATGTTDLTADDIERIDVNGGNGDDDIDLDGVTTPALIDAGAGNDTVDAATVTTDVTILGGGGDDNLEGGLGDDLIDAGSGSDLITGNAGNDTILAGDGDDSATGDAGDDEFFGGDGDDLFTWSVGDGTDLVEGEGGSDFLVVNGDANDETFTFNDDGGFLDFERDLGGRIIGTTLESVELNAGDGADTVQINQLPTIGLEIINVDLGGADAATDSVIVEGSIASDTIDVAQDGVDAVLITGVGPQIEVESTDQDTLTVNGNEGDDVIKAVPGVEAEIGIVFNGGQGDDYLSADATLSGGAGNDTLEGGTGDDSLDGGAGDDTFLFTETNVGGTDTLIGGDGTDTVLVVGTPGDDDIDVTGTGIDVNTSGPTTIDGASDTLERVVIDSGDGDDDIDITGTTGGVSSVIVNAGTGDDDVTGSTQATPLTVDGGSGNDTINGSTGDDLINGGDGNDSIEGFDGGDVISGGNGTDTITGGIGDDTIEGGAAVDVFFWESGDGRDVISGGDNGSDIAGFTADGMSNTIAVDSEDGVLTVTVDGDQNFLDGVETVFIETEGGGDTVTVADVTGTELSQLEIDLGGDGDDVTVEGRDANDAITVSTSAAGEVDIAGFEYEIGLTSTTDDDTLTVNGNDGDDSITAINGVDDEITLVLNGGQGNDALTGDGTLNGDAGNDVLTGLDGNNSLNGGDGDDVLNLSDGDDTLSGGDGFDIVQYNGTEDDDTLGLDETAGVITVSGVVTGTADVTATDLERIDVNGGNGDDNIDLSGLSIEALVSGGVGNDDVDASGVTASSVTISGGDGDDVLAGGDLADEISGGAGDDTITGNAGDDALYGGADSDEFRWDFEDGSDLVEGGTGVDHQFVDGDTGPDDITITASGGRTLLTDTTDTLDMADVEEISVKVGDGSDSVTVNDMTGTSTQVVNLDLGAAGDFDMVTARGTGVADNIGVNDDGGTLEIEGLAALVNIANGSGLGADGDLLIVEGAEGDDIIKAEDGVESTMAIQLVGNAGNDYLSADASLIGGSGDDTLEGGSGSDTLRGNSGRDLLIGNGGDDLLDGDSGHDTFVGGDGNDTIEGGDGFDTVLIEGSDANNVISFSQTSDTSITHDVDGDSQTDTLMNAGDVERALILAQDGADLIGVTWTDGVAESLRVDVNGGADSTLDRIAVNDDGTGDLVLYRRGADEQSGSITVGPENAEPFVATFQDIEFVQPIAAADGEVRVLNVDVNEFNDTRTLATHLGANDTLNVDATIEPTANASLPFALPSDRDFYEIVADETGTLDITVFFDELTTVDSGRPGLPGDGNLDIQVRDADGTVIAGTGAFGDNDGGSELDIDGDADAENERVRIPVVAGQTYYLEVFGATDAALNDYSITTINDPAPVPFDLELLDNPTGDDTLNDMADNSDTGRNQTDNITRDNTPTIVFRLDDGIFLHDLPGNDADDTPPDQVIPIPFQAAAGAAGYRIAIFDEGDSPAPGTQTGTQPQTPLGYATAVAGQEGVYEFTTPVLSDGSHFLSARVQMVDPSTELQTGFGARSVSLEIVVDTVDPPVTFGLTTIADDGLDAGSDSGVVGQSGAPDTFIDRVTNDTTPTFFGTAEADSIVRVYVDTDDDGMLDPAVDRLIGQTVAVPLDGTDQHPNGRWELTSNVNMNDTTLGLGQDGTRRIFATTEDVAGNLADPDELLIFIDTRGPQVYDPAGAEQAVYIDGSPEFNLFGIKETGDALAPTPLVDAIRVNIQDLPNRDMIDANFLYEALLEEQAEAIGNVEVRGDLSGVIAIESIAFETDVVADGAPATGELVITFFEPLPDDRFTLTINDTLVDPAGNSLDGESNAAEPNGGPTYPTGDGQPGGNFSARFTVDSRPEIGAIGQNLVTLDLNGNGALDPMNGVTGGDSVNTDLVFDFGIETDSVFAGQFTAAGTVPGDEDGFDRLGLYGREGGVARFQLDFDNDGVVDFESTLAIDEPSAGAPIAGNFDDTKGGDEIGLFNANTGTWYLDTNGDNILGNAGDTTLTGDLRGAPIVGDFDGDGEDDLATYRADMDTFYFDLTGAADGTPGVLDGNADVTIEFGRPGVQERPFAADLDQDGIDDIGLKAPNLEANTPTDTADWFILLSDDRDMAVRADGTVDTLDHPFSPAPLGQDAFAQFATNNSEPIVGNFDPPVGAESSGSNVTLDFTGGALTVTATAGSAIEIGAVSGNIVITVDGQVNSSLGTIAASAVTSISVIGSADADSIDLSGVDGADFTSLTSVSVNAGGGDDAVTGSSLDDMIAGEGGNDSLSGGAGDDLLRGGAGRDVLDGGAGNDRLLGQGSSGDRLRGGLGDDTIDGGMGTDTVEEAGDQDFTLVDGSLTGGATGTDTLIDIEQAELTGGDSGNVIDASGFSGSVTVNGGNGADQITGGAIVDLIYGNDGDDTISGGGGNDIIHGMGGDDIIDGGDGDDMLRGGSGRDTITGGAGNDEVYGQGGTGDVLSGGAGDDLIDGGSGVDRVAEEADTDFTLADGSLSSAATGNDTLVDVEGGQLTGGAGNNTIDATGFSGFTTLRGGAGDDVILAGPGGTFAQGGAGNDSITGNTGFDLVNGQGGADTVDVSEADSGVVDQVTNDVLDSIFLDGIDDILI